MSDGQSTEEEEEKKKRSTNNLKRKWCRKVANRIDCIFLCKRTLTHSREVAEKKRLTPPRNQEYDESKWIVFGWAIKWRVDNTWTLDMAHGHGHMAAITCARTNERKKRLINVCYSGAAHFWWLAHSVQFNDDEDDNVKWWRFLQHLYKLCAVCAAAHQPRINQIAIKCLLFWQKQDKHFYEHCQASAIRRKEAWVASCYETHTQPHTNTNTMDNRKRRKIFAKIQYIFSYHCRRHRRRCGRSSRDKPNILCKRT